MARRPSGSIKLIIFLASGLALAAVTHAWWMAALGRLLVHDDGPERADMAVVLAGDFSGNRVVKAAQLVRQGYVPKVLVSGPHIVYGGYECDLAIPFAVTQGYPEEWFIRAPNEGLSTREEAVALLEDLKRLGVHRFLLVTSDYHTARAARIYRAAATGFDMRVVAAPDRFFRPNEWWHDREGRKIFVIEWMKTVASAFGM